MFTKEVINNTDLDKFTNSVKIVGVIKDAPVFSHSYDETDFYTARIVVNSGSRVSVIHVYLTKDMLEVDGVTLDKDIRVSVQGYLVQSKLKRLTDLSVRATSIEITDDEDYTAVYLGGTIIKESELIELRNSNKVIKSLIIRHQTKIDGKDWKLTAKALIWNNSARALDKDDILDKEVCVRGYLVSKEYLTDDSESVTLHEINGLRVINL